MRWNTKVGNIGAWAFLLLIVCALTCQAQEFRSTLTGVVTDPSGALIPGATITAVNVDSGTTYTGKASGKGVYFINYVLPGNYTVTATAPGFKQAKEENITLFAARTFNQNFSMQVGATGETVEVTTQTPDLETTTGSGGQVIGARELENVPLSGGQAYTLLGTTPGSQMTSQAGPPGSGGNSGTRGWDTSNSYTLGGGIVGNNQFTLNGVNITSQYGYDNFSPGEWTVSPNVDSIQEINVQTTTYDARFGRTSGGIVNVVSKSGGDSFHATARYAYEGSLFDANTYLNNLTDTPRQGYVQNQFWITAGGPIIKKKLFFFFGFEGYHQSIAGTTLENVAPAYLRPGYQGNTGVDFGLVQALDAQHFPDGLPVYEPGTAVCADGGPVTACNSNDIVQTEYPNDTIPATAINSTAAAVLKYLPLPNISGAENFASRNNYLGHTPDLYEYNQPQIRIDYNLSDKTKLYSYFLYWKGTETRSNNGLTGAAVNGNINHIRQNFVATQDVTHVFSPTFTGDFKIAYSRFYESSPNGDFPSLPSASALALSMPLPGTTSTSVAPEITVSDGWNTGFLNGAGSNTIFGNQLNNNVTNNYGINIDFTKSKGAHTFEFGAEIDEFQFGGSPYSGGHPNGDFSFNSQYTQLDPLNAGSTPNGSALADFYLGLPSSGGVDWIYSIMDGYPVYAGYFQDNWRATPKLTFNMGFRYDIQRGMRERHNHLNRGMCFTCVNPVTNDPTYQANIGNSANQAAWAAAGISPSSLTQVLGGIQFAGYGGQSRDAYDTDWSNAGPRFGFAYQINDKTDIRGGWGLMYSYGLEGGSSVGEAVTTNFTASTNGGSIPTNNFQSGSPFASGLLTPTGDSLGLETDLGDYGEAVDFPNRKIPREQIMSLGFQRELPGHTVLDVRYAGNFTTRLRTFLWLDGTVTLAQENAAIANPAIFNQQVPNPYYGVPAMSGPGLCGTATTIPAIELLTPLSQYCAPGGTGLVGEYNAPIGGNFYNGLETKVDKRITAGNAQGLSYQIAYTYSKTINEDGYRNGWPYQDQSQIHQLADTDRTHVLTVTSVYNLPFGRGGRFLVHPNGFADKFVSGWNLSGVFSAQSGTPVGINTGWLYTCPGHSYKPAGGSTLGHWFSDGGPNFQAGATSSCWVNETPYQLQPINSRTAQVRNPTTPNLDMAIQKTTHITERLGLDLRLDAFNLTNSVLFGGPDTNPGDGAAAFSPTSGWSGFGTVGPTQVNFPRVLQVSGKLSF